MKCIYVVLLLAFATVQAEDKYSTENDNLDIDGVVNNLESLKGFLGCFMDTAPCNPVAADFKKDIPEAINTSCIKCTDAQKHIFRKFLVGIKEKLPSDFEAFKKKFDPENKQFTALETAVASY